MRLCSELVRLNELAFGQPEQNTLLNFIANAMCKLLSDQLIQLETRSLQLLIEPDAQGMHQARPQEAIAQRPQIACPDALDRD